MSDYKLQLLWTCALQLFILTTLLPESVVAPAGHSLLCFDCHHAKHAHHCNLIKKCAPDQMCGMVVHEGATPEELEFRLECRDILHCPPPQGALDPAHLMGRRAHHPHVDPHKMKCDECCHNKSLCNQDLCMAYHLSETTTTTAAATTTTTIAPTAAPTTVAVTAAPTAPPTAAPTAAPTTAFDPNCRDHEEDGFACAMLDLFHLCTDTSTISYVIAHEKCARHCGLCTPDPNAAVVAPAAPPPGNVCTNYEQDGIKCAFFDLYHMCTDMSSIGYVFSHEKCREHCGYCTPGDVYPASTVATQPPTAAPATAAPTTAKPTTTTVATPAPTSPVFVIVTQKPTSLPLFTATSACKDVEENGFSCAYMDAMNICTSTEPLMHTLAMEKCKKHCGICK